MLVSLACTKKEPQKSFKKNHNNTFYKKAFVFQDKNDLDSAFFYFNQAKELFTKNNDSLGIGKSLVNMAFLQENLGDYLGSIETSLDATKFLNEKDSTQAYLVFCNYNNLGINSNSLKNYDDALKFYNKARPFANNQIDKMMLDNNFAVLFHNQKRYPEAIAIYQKLLDSVGQNSEYYPKLLLNFSRSKWFYDNTFDPSRNYLLAEQLSQNFEDDWTKDAAYAYLSSYFLKKNKDFARIFALKMLSIAKKLDYPTDQLEALQTLIKVSDADAARSYFQDYTKIDDSLKNAQNQSKNQFAVIRFESEKAKSENLEFQKEHQEHEHQVERQKIITLILIFTILICIIFAYIWIAKKREKLILESENKLQNQRLDFSKKIHDVVANGIYEVMAGIENQKEISKEKVLDKLELMYEKSRDLSYQKPMDQDFNEQMSAMIHSFDNTETQIIVIGNDYEFWKFLTQFQKQELQFVIRELLVNMKKHSQANQVILRFIKHKDEYEIQYRDNGIGLPTNFVAGNGFTNILSRLSNIHANFINESVENGLKISIKF